MGRNIYLQFCSRLLLTPPPSVTDVIQRVPEIPPTSTSSHSISAAMLIERGKEEEASTLEALVGNMCLEGER